MKPSDPPSQDHNGRDHHEPPGTSSVTRRETLRAKGVPVALEACGVTTGAAAEDVPVTGDANGAFESFDRLMSAFVRDRRIPGVGVRRVSRPEMPSEGGVALTLPAALQGRPSRSRRTLWVDDGAGCGKFPAQIQNDRRS